MDVAALFQRGKRDFLTGTVVLFAAVVVYANSLGNGFVWDDTNVILTNDALRGGPLALFRSIDATRDFEPLPYYRPLTQVSFLVEGRLHGFTPFWMHFVNLILHSMNSVLVYVLVRSLAGNGATALMAGLLFAVHPVNTEAVNFLSGGRNTILSCMFSLLVFLIYRRSAMRNSLTASVAAGLLLLAGLLSKEPVIMVVPFIVWLGVFEGRNEGRSWVKAGGLMIPSFIAVACYLVMRWFALSRLGIQMGIIPGPGSDKFTAMYKMPGLWDRVSDNLYIIPRYLLTIINPTTFSLRYEVPASFSQYSLPLFAAWLSIIGGLIWITSWSRSRLSWFGLFWLVLFYLPVSGLVMLPSAPMADRYLYLPAIGLWILVADQTERMLGLHKAVKRYGSAFVVLVLIILAGVTFVRNRDWQSDITLFGRFADHYPKNVYSHAGLGNAFYMARGTDSRYLDLAEAELLKAAKLNPRIPGVYTTLGNISLTKGDNISALRYYTAALDAYPLDKEALLNRAITFENLDRGAEALRDFNRFLAIPGYELSDARPYAEARVRMRAASLR